MTTAESYEQFIRDRITELRQEKNISEHKMSLELGKGGSYIRGISSGKAMPSMREFCRICEYLDITPEEFFMGSSGPSVKTSIVNHLRELNDKELVRVDTFLDWMRDKESANV